MRVRACQILSILGLALLLLAATEAIQAAISLEGGLISECGPEAQSVYVQYNAIMLQISVAAILGSIMNYQSKYVKKIAAKFNSGDLKRLFLGMVVAGGSVYNRGGKYCIRFYGKDYTMHQVFNGLSYELYRSSPSTIQITGRGSYITQLYCKEAVMDINELSPETNARKGGIPTIEYILEGNRSIRQESMRVIMSVAGWVGPSLKRTAYGYSVATRIGLGSSNPLPLNEEYKTLAESLMLKLNSYSDSRYPDTGYLMSYDSNTCSTFLRMGGFVEGSLVKKGRYAGREKNSVLKASLVIEGSYFDTPASAERVMEDAVCNNNFELSALLGRIMLG
ncbi:MAG: hypothetical protein QFX34_04565 [Candidatus Verstraetearchaeota archaeon]|nr:hypothetical protein [Candidatus Verstraetearchaeota archaeon]